MNKKLSIGAFVFFSIAWVFDIATDVEISGLMNVGLMWLTMAAIVGRESA